jgi:PiT family inorganic phosphate transporter
MGVGFTSGLAAVDMRVVGGVVISWFITLPAGAIMAILFFYALKGMFGISCPVCI